MVEVSIKYKFEYLYYSNHSTTYNVERKFNLSRWFILIINISLWLSMSSMQYKNCVTHSMTNIYLLMLRYVFTLVNHRHFYCLSIVSIAYVRKKNVRVYITMACNYVSASLEYVKYFQTAMPLIGTRDAFILA